MTGRRKARRPRVARIVRAQGSSSLAVAGWHTKMRARLGVSPGPVMLYGPAMRDAGHLRRIDARGNFEALQLRAIQAQIHLGRRRRLARAPACWPRRREERRAARRERRFRASRIRAGTSRRWSASPLGWAGELPDGTARTLWAAALVELDANGILGIDREVILEGKAAARIEGKIVADALIAVAPDGSRCVLSGGELFHRRV